MTKILHILILISVSRLLHGQTTTDKLDRDSLVKFSFECKGKKKTFKIPAGHLSPKYSDHQAGKLITINYPDSSYIKILCGTYALLLSDNNTDLNERKEYVDDMTIVYEYVKNERLKYFKKSFDKIAKGK